MLCNVMPHPFPQRLPHRREFLLGLRPIADRLDGGVRSATQEGTGQMGCPGLGPHNIQAVCIELAPCNTGAVDGQLQTGPIHTGLGAQPPDLPAYSMGVRLDPTRLGGESDPFDLQSKIGHWAFSINSITLRHASSARNTWPRGHIGLANRSRAPN